MDLAKYDGAKFELAAILRSAAAAIKESRPGVQAPFADLFARLAEDRFNLVVVGRFSRGKSSLMNAMLRTERLPTGIVPLTSVITTVSYGSREQAIIEREGWSLDEEIGLDVLPDYITQQGNPGNSRGVKLARVELPSDLLRRGFHFIDTPGLGSAIAENTRTTEQFLPQADAFMLVTSYDSPLSEEELRILHRITGSARQVFLVVNKRDTATETEQAQVLAHVREQAALVFGEVPRLFSVSAREAIEANRRHDREQWSKSGIAELTEELTRFLLSEKQSRFLLAMCDRVERSLHDVPDPTALLERLRRLRREVVEQNPQAPLPILEEGRRVRFSGCAVCEKLEQGIYDFLCQFQYDISIREDLQAELAAQGGLCPFHTWQYEAVASPQGTCSGFAGLLASTAERLRTRAKDPMPSWPDRGLPMGFSGECPICRAHRELESAAVAEVVESFRMASSTVPHPPSLCLPHLPRILAQLAPDEMKACIEAEAKILERISEDMQRYALKHDGTRRFLASAEELSAARRGLMLLAGHRNVSGLWRFS